MKSKKGILLPLHIVIALGCWSGLFFSESAAAETDIGNGTLFVCDGTTIVSVKTNSLVLAKKAKKRFRSIIDKQTNIIESSSGNKKRRRAIRKRKAARRGRRDVMNCVNGELDGIAALDGDWNLILENGLTPAENGYNSMTLEIDAGIFIQVLDGVSLDCHWEGAMAVTATDPLTVDVLTTIGTGSTFCSNAVDVTKSAEVSLSNADNTLTIDYRPEGTLQVYERQS